MPLQRLVASTLVVSLVLGSAAPAVRAQEIGVAEDHAEQLPSTELPVGSDEFCHARGLEDAEQAGTGGSFVGGVAAGALLGFVGTAIAVVAQSPATPPLDSLAGVQDCGDTCASTYLETFKKRSESRNCTAALNGSLVGMAILIAVVAVSHD